MNTTPITCLHSTSMPQMFNLFRALGLRHMLVLNDNNEVSNNDLSFNCTKSIKSLQVVGIVTRKDLARFRVKHSGGHMEREVVHITEQVH